MRGGTAADALRTTAKSGRSAGDFCFENDLVMRASGDRMLLSPPLVIARAEIDELVGKARRAIELTAQRIGR